MQSFDDFPRGLNGDAVSRGALATASWSFDAPLWREGHIYLGRDAKARDVGRSDDRHMITIAGSRAGKGRSAIIPNLLRWPGSCVVLDPKGENASVTAELRAKWPGHKVVVLDPCNVAKIPDDLRASFNPLDLINADQEEAIDLAAAIGDALMVGSGDGKDIHWTESARQIVEALILYVAATETGPRRSLVRVRQLLTQGDPNYAAELSASSDDPVTPFDALWTRMANIDAGHETVRDVVIGAANSIADMGENERGSVLSTARRNTKFIESGFMRRCLQRGDRQAIDINALKSAPGGVTIYVCLPARFIPTHARFLRLVLNLILYRMESQGLTRAVCGHPVLFVLDEFAAIGRLECIEKAAGLMAGFGVKLWPVLQDLGQLKRHYKESYETFLGNAGVLQFFANTDLTTLEWLSKCMGQVELLRETSGSSESTTSSLSKSQSMTEQSGWSRSQSTTEGRSDMPELQTVAARDGSAGLVPFIARAGASGAGHSQSRGDQLGQSGNESRQTGDSASSGSSETATVTQSIHQAPLMTPDEIAWHFDRKRGRQIVFIDSRPGALTRVDGTKCPARSHDRLDSQLPLTSTFNYAANEGAARKTIP